ncbi:MAG: 3-methyl-2-oxobutanoate hydroxymethyltransferase [Planctomycetota bacterium]
MSCRKKTTLSTLREMKRRGERISMLTAYDYTVARLEEAAGVDSILVGDSAAQVVFGHDSTLPATMDLMIALAAAVRRGAPSVFLVGDMPYLSFNLSVEEAIKNAGRFMADAGCDCVKLEADSRLAETVRAMTTATIPVMVHLGLRPQAVHQIGGYRAQGKDALSAQRLIEDAKILEDAGACALLLEAVPPEPAKLIAEGTAIPVIGCGAGPFCDGHVVVLHDMLGLTEEPRPRFVKPCADLRAEILRGVEAYVAEIKSRSYPAEAHCYRMADGEADRLRPARER